MAELLRTQGYRVQVSGVPSAATPQVSFGQQPRPEVEFQARANYQQTLAITLDKMSQAAFGIAAKAGERAGAQFALENPLTQEQLQAMSRGDMSTVDLGSPMNVFSSMVRKVRAAELSAHMEAEARQVLVSIYNDAVAGKISTEDAKGKIEGQLNAGGSTLGQVDPDAAYKYRASIAAAGSKVVDEIGKVELKRRAIANELTLTTDYRNVMTAISAYMSSTMPVNPRTGEEWDLMEVVGKIKENFLANAFALGGLPAMESYAAKLDQDIPQLKIDAITRAIIGKDPDIGGDAFAAMDRLRKGQAGKYNNVYNSMSPVEQSAMRVEIHKAYNEMANLRSADRAAQKQRHEDEARELISNYFKTGNPKHLEDLNKIAIDSGAVSVDYVAGLPKALRELEYIPRNPLAEMRLKDDIRNGYISNLSEFLARGADLGVPQSRLVDIFNYLDTADRRINNEIESDARRAAGLVPGQQNSTYRQTESYYNYLSAVDNEFAVQMQQWEAGGRKGPKPTKSTISQRITNFRRTAVPSTMIDAMHSDLNSKYRGPNGTIKKSGIDFKNDIKLNHDQSSGMPIGLSIDSRNLLQRNGFNQGQINDVEQTLMSIDLQQRNLDSIRSQQ